MQQTLNDKQMEAVLHTEGPLLILAGAGSGKTRVLTNRIAYLIGEKQVNPWNILAITFTNKAADEMRERVDRIVGSGSDQIWVATFHSTCVRILRRYIDRIGYDNNFSIYDTDDQKTLIKSIIKDLNIDTNSVKERAAMKVISGCKDEMVDPEEYEKGACDYREELIAKIYKEYQLRLSKNNALDFDDLLVKCVELFEKCPEVLDSYQERFRYILVDEYQDTNNVQFRFIQLLADKYKNICVVGDDDQSIYKFRGANIENILNFESVFKHARVIKLEQNYRSTGNILNAANAVIAHNKGRKEKTLWTSREDGTPVRLFQYQNGYDEADAVIREIAAYYNADPDSLNKFAILYRTNAQSRLFEERCVQRGLPYQMIGGVNFYQRKEIKDVLAYLKTIDNGRDDLMVRRIINVPKRGIGATSIEKVAAYARMMGIGFYDACLEASEIPSMGKAAEKIKKFTDCISELKSNILITDMIDAILEEAGYRSELEEEGEIEAQARMENIEELKNKAAVWEDDLTGFLADVALVADIDSMETEGAKLTLMTLHGAKGLEFPQVYMVGMEEGLFPSALSINSDDRSELEEERRICYVGITRAMDRLTITFARERMINGQMSWSKASRFVDEIPDEYLEKHLLEKDYGASSITGHSARELGYSFGSGSGYDREFGYGYGSGYGRDSSFGGGSASGIRKQNTGLNKEKSLLQKVTEIKKASSLEYGVGDRVSHIKFGEGTVTEITDGERDYEVTVAFDDWGQRKLLAGFAKLQKQT